MIKKNLLLISLDTVRADVIYSGRFENFENIRKDSISFLNTISSSPLTPVSHASVFTGLQPFNHGIRHLFKEQLKSDTETLANIFKKNGYNTTAIVSCPGMNKRYGFDKGFTGYDDEIPRLLDGSDPLLTIDVEKRGTALKRANIVSEKAIKLLETSNKEPFFLFLHFFDAHRPYEAPENFGGENYYEEEISFSLHYLTKVIDQLKKMGIYDETTIICFSDHGEDLNGWYPNDKGGAKLGHPEEKGHGCLLYDQTQKVLLTIKDSGLDGKGINIDTQVRLVDIMPTILDLFGFKYNLNLDGISLINLIKGKGSTSLVGYSETFYPEEQKEFTGISNKKSYRIENTYKIIEHTTDGKKELYNLSDDKNEINNLLKKQQ